MFEYLLKIPGGNVPWPRSAGYINLLYSATPIKGRILRKYKRYHFDCEGKWVPRIGAFCWYLVYKDIGNYIHDRRSLESILAGCCPPQLSSVILELGGMSG